MAGSIEPCTGACWLARLAIVCSALVLGACTTTAERVAAVDRAAGQGQMPLLVAEMARQLNQELPTQFVENMMWLSATPSGLTIDNRLSSPSARLKGKSPKVAASLVKKLMVARVCGTNEFTRLLHHGMIFNMNIEDDRGRRFARTSLKRGDC